MPRNGPLVAVTVPVAAGWAPSAGRRLIVPTVVVQVNAGCVFNAMPNWSLAVAVNCCMAARFRLIGDGLMPTVVSVWFTVTFTLLVAVSPSGSVIVTVKTYVPAWLNVAVVFFAALVPLALNLGARKPAGHGRRLPTILQASFPRVHVGPQHRQIVPSCP